MNEQIENALLRFDEDCATAQEASAKLKESFIGFVESWEIQSECARYCGYNPGTFNTIVRIIRNGGPVKLETLSGIVNNAIERFDRERVKS